MPVLAWPGRTAPQMLSRVQAPLIISQHGNVKRPQIHRKFSCFKRHASSRDPSQAQSSQHRLEGPSFANLLIKQTGVMFASGAVLGPLCDAQHSRYGVLKYADPISIPLPQLGYTLETCWWVPLLFGLAGIILGVGYPLLDRFLWPPSRDVTPWSIVIPGITLFVLQYWASGALSEAASPTQLLVILSVVAALQMALFDRTRTGLALSLLTAICGPAIEVVLIANHLYAYSHPEVAGVPLWITAVYFAGGPAVGNLGRAVWSSLQSSE